MNKALVLGSNVSFTRVVWFGLLIGRRVDASAGSKTLSWPSLLFIAASKNIRKGCLIQDAHLNRPFGNVSYSLCFKARLTISVFLSWTIEGQCLWVAFARIQSRWGVNKWLPIVCFWNNKYYPFTPSRSCTHIPSLWALFRIDEKTCMRTL